MTLQVARIGANALVFAAVTLCASVSNASDKAPGCGCYPIYDSASYNHVTIPCDYVTSSYNYCDEGVVGRHSRRRCRSYTDFHGDHGCSESFNQVEFNRKYGFTNL